MDGETLINEIQDDSKWATETEREKIDKGDHLIYRLQYGDARYEFDNMLCSIGWLQFDTASDAWYFGVWVNPEKRMIVTYAEGDLSLEVCEDTQAYNAAIKRCVDFYEEGQIFTAIDLDAKTRTVYVQDRSEFFISVS